MVGLSSKFKYVISGKEMRLLLNLAHNLSRQMCALLPAYFDARSNQLWGTIPTTLDNVVNLYQLDLRYNRLTGSIPPALFALKDLYALGLGYNSLNGTLADIEPGSLESLGTLCFVCVCLNNRSVPCHSQCLPCLEPMLWQPHCF